MPNYPDIQTGTKWWNTTAAAWQELMTDVEGLGTISVGPGLAIDKTSSGLAIRLDLDQIRPTASRKRVAVIRIVVPSGPEDETTPNYRSIIVREVRYAASPPIEGEYAFHGPEFHAWPQIGTELDDFFAFALGDRPLQSDTPMLTADRLNDFWFVDVPTEKERLVIVKAFADTEIPPEPPAEEPTIIPEDPESRFVMIHEIREKIVDGVWTGEYEKVGDVMRMPCWPTLRARYFRPFLWRPDALDDRMTVLPMGLHRGVWHVMQHGKHSVIRRQGPVQRSPDCGLFEAPGGSA